MSSTIVIGDRVDKFVAVVQFIHPGPGFQAARRKHYDFWCNVAVRDDDVVVVDTMHGLQLATVVGIKKTTTTSATKWVVQRVDTAEHNKRVYAEARKAELHKAMAARLKAMERIELFRKAAETDPTMAAMIKEYEDLGVDALVWEHSETQRIIDEADPYYNVGGTDNET